MDPVVAVLVVVVVAAAVAWWLLRRRRPAPIEDEWTLPPVAPGAPTSALPPGPGQPLLDRDALVNRSRSFDPSRWDNSPEGAEPGEDGATEGDLPRFFDRDYLKQRDRPDDSTPR